jgi:hypothetical protein
MDKTRKSLLALMILFLLMGPGIVRDAEAEIRVNATLHTPNISVRVGNMPAGHYRSYARGHLPVRRVRMYMITMRDRKIARRLAWCAGVPVRELLRLRRRGYHWFEIGRWLRLPRRLVRAAMHQRSWRRYLREERWFARRGARVHMGRR